MGLSKALAVQTHLILVLAVVESSWDVEQGSARTHSRCDRRVSASKRLSLWPRTEAADQLNKL